MLGEYLKTVLAFCACLNSLIVSVPLVSPGDFIVVYATGAYNYSMASNYNRIPRPPVVMLSKGESYVAVKRESYAFLTKRFGFVVKTKKVTLFT